ncbi:MAG: hypothetical protein GY822_32800, partial [Deltaproteobacteria bacterium]|nr:hypothetical protein [Deltaproteobacteria bacterium]
SHAPSIRTHHRVPSRRSVPVDFSITPAEQGSLDKSDLGAFWGARVQKDAVARIGLGMWGKKGELEKTILNSSDDELNFWRPNPNFLSSMAVSFTAPGLNTDPQSRTELVDY